MKTRIRKLAPSLLLLALFVVACFRLGLWQWDRASEFKEVKPDLPRVSLEEVARPGTSLDSSAYGRLVSTSGTYLKSWLVDDRRVDSRTGPWQVALLQTQQGQLLVVRSWGDSPLPTSEISIEGRLYPPQTPETATTSGDLNRVDPALIVNQASGPLFDGFVIATNEIPDQRVDRVAAPQPTRNPPGFYWQHISYVILWWFFGLLGLVVWARSAREELRR